MSEKPTDAGEILEKLGARLRDGHAKLYPVTEKDLNTIYGTIRDQYEQELAIKRTKAIEPTGPTKEHEPGEPER